MSWARTIRSVARLPVCAAGMLLAGSIHAQDYFGSSLPGTMCHADETILFACDTRHAKKIAVCARAVGGSAFGDIRYRFGTDVRTELEFPSRPQPLDTYATGASMGDGQRGMLIFLSLRQKDTTYSVYSMVVNPTYQHDGASESNGVLVERAGKVLANIHCEQDSNPHAGMLSDKKLLGVAVPLSKQPLSIFPQFRPTP